MVETTPALQEPQVAKVGEECPKLSLGLAMIQWPHEKIHHKLLIS
jgi:hypothetical protein